MSLTRVEEVLENLQANCVADRNNFKGDFFKEKTVEKYIFVFTPILIKLTFSGCRCAAFYERSTDSSRKLLIKCLILLGSLQGGGGREILFPLTLNLCKMTFSCCRCAAFYDRSTDSSRKLLIKRLILLGSLQRGGGREILFPFDPEPVQNDLQLLQIFRLLAPLAVLL